MFSPFFSSRTKGRLINTKYAVAQVSITIKEVINIQRLKNNNKVTLNKTKGTKV